MANVKIHKVTALPSVWDVNAVYFVKTGAQVSIYVTDSAGTPYNAESDPLYTASVSKQMMIKGYGFAGSNANSFTDTGLYPFGTVAAEQSTNMPVAQAGVLEVINDTITGLIYHKYRASGGNQYKRLYAGSWSTWVREPLLTEIFQSATSPYANLCFQDTGLFFHSGSEPDNPMPGYPGYSLNKYMGGQYSLQFYIASNYGSGSGGYMDGLFMRSNNAGGLGSGWPTPWVQLASRDWVNANTLSLSSGIQNQNTSYQNADFKISGGGEIEGDFTVWNGVTSVEVLGVGVTNPSEALEVQGNAQINGIVYTNAISPASGVATTFGGDVVLTTVASNLLKVDVTGKIIPAVENVDYVAFVGETVLTLDTTQTISVNTAFPTASTTACIVYCDTSDGNIILTLPGALDFAGKGPISFIKIDNSGNKIVIKGAGTTLINNSNVHELTVQYQKATVRGGSGGQYWLF